MNADPHVNLSQSLMFHASQHASQFFASPDRLEEEEDLMSDVASSSSSFSSSSSSSSSSSRLSSSGASTSTAATTPPPSHASSQSTSSSGSPSDILTYAYEATLKQREVPAGSATACILTFDSTRGTLRSANLGDSGFLILRTSPSSSSSSSSTPASEAQSSSKVLYVSKPQTHGFNTPLQLSKLPPQYRFDGSIDSKPAHAEQKEHQLREGDVVLVATDGYWDNVSADETVQLVRFVSDKHRAGWKEQQQAAGVDSSSADEGLDEEKSLAQVLAHK